MAKKTTVKVERQVVLEAFAAVKQLSSDKIGEVVAHLVNNDMMNRENATEANLLLQNAVNASVDTIMTSKGV
jgi:hypothetical protein